MKFTLNHTAFTRVYQSFIREIPPNSGKTIDTVFNMVYLITFHVCAKQVGEPYTLGSSNNVFHIILDFI